MAGIEYRPAGEGDIAAFVQAVGTGFGFVPDAEAVRHEGETLEWERTVAAFDEGQVVGTSGSLTFDLAVPGGAHLGAAGVTAVTVRPTHRRRGVLTSMMGRLFDDAIARREALAMLWASESVIYGRFGYGIGTEHEEWTIERRHAAMRHGVKSPGRLRMVDASEARAVWPELWERVRLGRAGMPSRNERRWASRFAETEWQREGMSGAFYVQYEEDGRVDGHAIYRMKEESVDGNAASRARVDELVPATEAAHAALWRMLLDLDLTTTISARQQPGDDALWWMLADPRRLVRRRHDGLWLRILDVAAALSARRYAAEGRLVLEVRDEQVPANARRWLLEGASDGARCEPTDEAPDLVMPVASLGAAYLGNARFEALARSLRLEERAPGALVQADAMFATPRAPWCPEFF
jgi:predicted acetyltransferase